MFSFNPKPQPESKQRMRRSRIVAEWKRLMVESENNSEIMAATTNKAKAAAARLDVCDDEDERQCLLADLEELVNTGKRYEKRGKELLAQYRILAECSEGLIGLTMEELMKDAPVDRPHKGNKGGTDG